MGLEGSTAAVVTLEASSAAVVTLEGSASEGASDPTVTAATWATITGTWAAQTATWGGV